MNRADIPSPPPVIFLMGPTASGKTTLAVEMARSLPVEIISVDSAMVYRGMDIGTAKPGPDILSIAPHRLIDVCEPEQTYSAGCFCSDARSAINEIHAQGKIPLLVGGTGLYFRSLQLGFSQMPAANHQIRLQLEAEADRIGWGEMHAKLASVDPAAAARIHRNDPQRIQRALEIYQMSGKTMTEFHLQGRIDALPHTVLKLIVAPADKSVLNARIKTRFMEMLEAGLVSEVERLYHRSGLTAASPSMRLVGYRQVWAYLHSEYDYNTMIDKTIIATRQLAKRQLTWLRAEQQAEWLDASHPQLSQYLLNFLGRNLGCSYRLY